MRAALRRVIQLVVVLLCVSFFSFALLSLAPGDPVVAIVGFASPAQIHRIRHQLHFDRPFLVQYWEWLSGLFHGNLGNQYFGPTGVGKVSTALGQALPVSLQLMAYTMILTVIIAIPLGVLAAYRVGHPDRQGHQHRRRSGRSPCPTSRWRSILSYWVGVKLHWLPSQGYDYPTARLRRRTCRHMALPTISLAVGQIAGYMRLLRSDMIATLQEDYILMAKAKGITEPADPVATRSPTVEPHARSPSPASTSVRSSAGRS